MGVMDCLGLRPFLGDAQGRQRCCVVDVRLRIGALAVTLSLLHTGAYAFGRLEIGILLSCTVAYLIGRNYPRVSVVMSVATMLIAGSGLIVDMWVAPAQSTWWFWMLCSFSSGLSVYALSRDWKKTIEDTLPPVASTAYNSLIFLLVIL